MSKQPDYKALRAELDQILQSLDDPNADVETMTKQYQRGMAIIAELETYVKKAENSIKKVKS